MAMTPEEVARRGELLREYATHFVERDWIWSRKHGIKRITHAPPPQGTRRRDGSRKRFDESQLPARLTRAVTGLFKKDIILPEFRVSRYRMFRARLRMNNLPDGHLESAGVIAYWEETGEYLQMVQPSVGALVAEFLEQSPEHPSAIKIAEELERIAGLYRDSLVESYGARAELTCSACEKSDCANCVGAGCLCFESTCKAAQSTGEQR